MSAIEGCFTSLDELLQKHAGAFSCIYADPPWQYDKTVGRAAAAKHYPTMSMDELKALPVGELAAEKSHLHLWATAGFLWEGLDLLSAWGFQHEGEFIWCKPQMGCGNYVRVSHEVLLLGVRGQLPFVGDPPEQSWLVSPRRDHSEKPEVFRELVEAVSPSPRLELFGRKPAAGWCVFGNEILGGSQSRLFSRW